METKDLEAELEFWKGQFEMSQEFLEQRDREIKRLEVVIEVAVKRNTNQRKELGRLNSDNSVLKKAYQELALAASKIE